MMSVNIKPTKEQVRDWIENFVPEKDLFFLEEMTLDLLAEDLDHVLVIPRTEFFDHASYKQIQLVNSYMYWNISDKVKYVIVAQPDWITNLPEQKKREILFLQYQSGRGLIFPLSFFADASFLPEAYIFEDKGDQLVVIQRDMWDSIPYQERELAIQSYAQLWDHWSSCPVPLQTPFHLKKYANKFTTVSGSNCLSAALYAITEQDWMIDEWVHPDTFLNGLERAGFSYTDEQMDKGDVMAWVNDDDIVVHAAYHIDHHYFFNKNGQTFFNPWKIVTEEQLNDEWGKYRAKVYRKG